MREKIINYIRDYFNLGNMVILGHSNLTLDLGLSSFELLEMFCKLEEVFKKDLSEEQIAQIKTIDDIVQLIEV